MTFHFTGASSVLLLPKAGSSRIGSSRTLGSRLAAFRCITFVLYTARRLRLVNQSNDSGISGEGVTLVTMQADLTFFLIYCRRKDKSQCYWRLPPGYRKDQAEGK